MSFPITILHEPRPRDGDFLATLAKWGALGDEPLPIPDAARMLSALCAQNEGALLKIIVGAVTSQEIPSWYLASTGTWEPGWRVWLEGKTMSPPDERGERSFVAAQDGPWKLHLSATGVRTGDLVVLLVRRGRKVPDELLSVVPMSEAPDDGGAVRPVQRQAAHAESILSALRRAGFDPLLLPPRQSGRACTAKTAARAALANMSRVVFDKAWQTLRDEGRIRP